MTSGHPGAEPPDLALLTGVRSGKRSYYREFIRTDERMQRTVRALDSISRALVRTVEGPRSLLEEVARTAARDLGIPLREGVYMYFPGPQYETPAEVRFARVAGADAVGMSTAPEVIVAGHCGMQVLGFTLVSNLAAGILDQPLSEQEVLDAAEACKDKFSRLVLACLERI